MEIPNPMLTSIGFFIIKNLQQEDKKQNEVYIQNTQQKIARGYNYAGEHLSSPKRHFPKLIVIGKFRLP